MPSLMKGNKWIDRCDAVDRQGNPIVTYPVMVEVKHDEIRCHVIVHDDRVEFLSYAGKPLANLTQFAYIFKNITKKHGIREFDCGFECNGNFNDSYRWVRSTKGLPKDLEDKATRFYLFDLPTFTLTRYADRRKTIVGLAIAENLGYAEGHVCRDAAEVVARYVRYREQGYEGAMVKSLDHYYQPGKRIDGWLKLKPSDDATGTIVGIQEAISLEGKSLGRAGSVRVALADGSVAHPAGIAHNLGFDMWEHPEMYIGKFVEFKYMERDRAGGYRHPSFLRFVLEV